MSNPVTFQQSSTVLNSIVQQATGRSSIIATEGDFISAAQTALSMGKDKVFNALSEVFSRTIFSNRPYSASMKGLEKTLDQWGAAMRKINIVESDWKDNDAYKYPVLFDSTQNPPTGNGLSVDPWVINKREFLETYFLGQSVFSDNYTVFEDQLETAFRNSAEFGAFLALITTNMNNKLEVVYENVSRFLVSNFAASLIAENNSSRVVKLLTLYNTETGQSYTATDIRQPDKYPAFVKWAYAKIAAIASRFKEYSVKYQTTISGKYVPRHTPYDKQKMYMLSDERYAMDSRVLADTFHDNYLKYADVETVNFWQSIDSPDIINIKPTYTNTSGVITTPTNAVNQAGVFALLFDDDAMGWARIHQNVIPTGINGRGEYRNLWYNMRIKCYQDNTEKGVVFLLV